MKSFDNRVAVVTGAASGMGRYLAVLLAKMGCNVAVCDVNEDELSKTASMLSQYNIATSVHLVDIADSSQIDRLHEEVIARHQKVDLVFNNAGITVMSDFENMPAEDWDRVMNVNLAGVVNMTRKFLPDLKSRPEAALINTSSIFGMVAVPGQSVYHATKFAVRGFTESLAKEMDGTNLQVHCVHPGHVGTNIASSAKEVVGGTAREMPAFMRKMSAEERGKMFKDNGMHPSRAAKIILDGVQKRRTRIFVGLDAKLMEITQRLFPQSYMRTWPFILLPMFVRNKFLKKPLPELPAEP
ncbi:MAG TPA: short-chain dehydrogenase [Porticoccaceae bacterium]|nr:short-chain dehydrogenase [Porticoccaceae bacterium]